MLSALFDYKLYEVIHENKIIKIFRGYSVKDRMPVIIKVLKEEATNPIEISKFIHEYEVTQNIDMDGIVKPLKFEQEKSFFALIMKDVDAVPLREYVKNHPIDIHSFLDIAISLTEILGQLHRRNIIHRDLKPENILINHATGKIYIMNFHSAVSFPSENNNLLLIDNLVGTLEYMSPEQTGRLNIGIDQRSDLYSLGVVLYEMISGQLPLKAKNPAEWAYAHLTQNPCPPEKINPDIPSPVSNIIMKLLKKNPEERYQSARGLTWDLKECRKQLLEMGKIQDIYIGRMDELSRFQLSDKFYGRKEEVERIRAAFKGVCEGRTETVLIGGEPGIGKTMLVYESLKPVRSEKCYFIMGKADQLKRNIPYAPYRDAFGSLIRRLMTEDSNKLLWWKNRILNSLGRNCAIITEVIPELEWIVGKQPPVEVLPPQEAENRFLNVFKDFIKVFAWKGHPLVMFLDDLQWADEASIKLLTSLTKDTNLNYLLIIGAFRENEVKDNHPLWEIFNPHDKIGQNKISHISLSPLEETEVEKLISDTLNARLEDSNSLSQWLYVRSAGNPFALKQLLMLIHDEGLLYFNMNDYSWQWNLEGIQKLKLGEEILEVILKKIDRFSDETKELLMLASCYGNMFDLNTLANLLNKPMEKVAATLMPSIHEGLFIKLNKDDGILYYGFAHDKVQQAVYSLLSEEEKKKKHIMIGSYLLYNTPIGSLEENILSIMDHFNRGLEIIEDEGKRIELTKYNLLAGRKAKDSAAYVSALEYFRFAYMIAPEDLWEKDYSLCFELYLEFAQALYLCGDAETAEKFFDILLNNSKTELERADVYGTKMVLYAGVGLFTEAAETGIQALKDLGMKIPITPKKLDFIKELFFYWWLKRGKSIEDLLYIPEMKDIRQRKRIEILARLCYVTMATLPDLYSYIIIKTGNYALKYGNSEVSAVGYSGHGIISGILFGDYAAGEKYGKVSIDLAEKYGLSYSKCIVYFVVGSLILPWTKHVAHSLEYLKKAVTSGMDAGNLTIAGNSHCMLVEHQFIMGTSLEKLKEYIKEKYRELNEVKHHHLKVNLDIYNTVVNGLCRQDGDVLSIVTELERDELINLAQKDKTSLATYYFYKMQMYYMAGDYRSALSIAQKIRTILGAVIGFMIYAEYFFYESLIITSLYDEMTNRDKKSYDKILKKNLVKLRKWSRACKENYEHKYLLVSAECSKLKNRGEEAMSLYDKAIASACKYGYVQNEALANELAAKFYLSKGMEKVAKAYFVDACSSYSNWGAIAKIIQLMDEYSNILMELREEDERRTYAHKGENDWVGFPLMISGSSIDNMDLYYI